MHRPTNEIQRFQSNVKFWRFHVYKLHLAKPHWAPPAVHINEIQRFYTMGMWTLANNIIIPNMKQNRQTVVEIWAFQVFTSSPAHVLYNMHDIFTKINRAHRRTMGYLCTTYEINPMRSSGDFVFTSSIWQNHIKPRPLHILMRFNVLIPWACGH